MGKRHKKADIVRAIPPEVAALTLSRSPVIQNINLVFTAGDWARVEANMLLGTHTKEDEIPPLPEAPARRIVIPFGIPAGIAEIVGEGGEHCAGVIFRWHNQGEARYCAGWAGRTVERSLTWADQEKLLAALGDVE